MHEAKTHLSSLLRRAAGGELIEIHSHVVPGQFFGKAIEERVPLVTADRALAAYDVTLIRVD